MLTPKQINALLNEPIYGWDSLTLLGDVEDFLDFSEAHIECQTKRELRAASAECDGMEFEDPLDKARYREHRVEGVQYRFNVSLIQRVRYSCLTAVITTIEWSLIVTKGRASFHVPDKPTTPKGRSDAVYLLEVFANRCGQNLAQEIKDLQTLTQVRNCVVHSAGRIETYEFAKELRQALQGHSGIKLSSSNFLGESIEVAEGYLQSVIERAKTWLPALEKAMHQEGLLR